MRLARRPNARSVRLALGCLLLGFLSQGAHAQAVAITRFSGAAVAPVTVSDRSGRLLRPSDYKGRIVIVNLWATWCGPCRAEMPTLERLAARFPRDLVVLAVSNDQDGWPTVDRFWRAQFPHLRSALAPGPELAGELGALGLPYSLIIGRDGREIARVTRGAEWDKGELGALVASSVAARRKG